MARHSSGQSLTGKKARQRFQYQKEVHGRAKRNGNNASQNGNGNSKNGSRGGR